MQDLISTLLVYLNIINEKGNIYDYYYSIILINQVATFYYYYMPLNPIILLFTSNKMYTSLWHNL